jgi:hypothetical protein
VISQRNSGAGYIDGSDATIALQSLACAKNCVESDFSELKARPHVRRNKIKACSSINHVKHEHKRVITVNGIVDFSQIVQCYLLDSLATEERVIIENRRLFTLR